MVKAVKVVATDPDHPVRWPHYCTECGAKENLVSAQARVETTRTVKHWTLLFGQHNTERTTLKMGYPVCPTHAAGLPLAHWITHNGGIPQLLRWVVYFFVATTVVGLGLGLFALLASIGAHAAPAAAKAARGLPTDWGMVFFRLAFFLTPIAAMAFIVRSYKKLPLRLTKLEDDAVTIRFKVDRYARAFERTNTDVVI